MTYRIYFNAAEPPCWSVDEGTRETEVCVQDIVTGDVTDLKFCTAQHRGVVGPPSAWVEVEGILSLEHGWAMFRPIQEKKR